MFYINGKHIFGEANQCSAAKVLIREWKISRLAEYGKVCSISIPIKKSNKVNSGDLGGHSIGLLLPIQLPR